jgi:hypothetical protein
MKELRLGDFREATKDLKDDAVMILDFDYYCHLCGEGCYTPEDFFRKFDALKKVGAVILKTIAPDHKCLNGRNFYDIVECIDG